MNMVVTAASLRREAKTYLKKALEHADAKRWHEAEIDAKHAIRKLGIAFFTHPKGKDT